MVYHVYFVVLGNPVWFLNMPEAELRDRVISSWEEGGAMTWDGRTVESGRTSLIEVFETDEALDLGGIGSSERLRILRSTGRTVTNERIVVPAGARRTAQGGASLPVSAPESPLRDHRRVMVVHGRNLQARNAMFTFLRALGLVPIEWEDAVAETGMGTPHNLDTVRAAMDVAQAVVVILTAEDEARLLSRFTVDGADEDERELRGQPRQNVILEAGLAMGVDPNRTVLVELGPIRRASDFAGLNVVRLTNASQRRAALRSRLQSAGCAVAERGEDWMGAEAGGDFESAVADTASGSG